MAKFRGAIGFIMTVEDSENPGVWIEDVVEKTYRGDLLKIYRKLQTSSNTINDNVVLSTEISIVADPYANENMFAMRYVTLGGAKWKIESIEVEYPRLKLSIGGIYNG